MPSVIFAILYREVLITERNNSGFENKAEVNFRGLHCTREKSWKEKELRSQAYAQKIDSPKAYSFCVGNHMISSAIWDKSARANFPNSNQIASAILSLYYCWFFQN